MWSRMLYAIGLGALLLLSGCDQPPNPPRASLGLDAVLGDGEPHGFARADAPRVFNFPADYGAHPDFRSEWWYLTFTLEDDENRPVGVQLTLFRQALAADDGSMREPPGNRWQTPQVYLAHFAVTDTVSGTHRASERFARGHPRLAGVTADPFHLWLEDWQVLAVDRSTWQLTVDAGEVGAALELSLRGAPVLQGEAGLSRKGERQASYYYSLPDIAVSGQVRVDGVERHVQGGGWLDREWSTSVLSAGQLGWDWFALSLDDGRRVMLFRLRRGDGARDPHDQGMVSAPGVRDRLLMAPDFELRPVRVWQDEKGVGWPVGWSVRLGSETWSVEAVMDDQRMQTSIRYWEGLVTVRDDAGARIGRGYLELTGYDDARQADGLGGGWR